MEPIKKQFAVVFTRSNARIVKYQDLKELGDIGNVVINPNLSLVAGIPPHFWKLDSGHIIPMSDEEKKERLKLIDSAGVENDVMSQRIDQMELEALKKLQEDIDRNTEEDKARHQTHLNNFDEINGKHEALKSIVNSMDGANAARYFLLDKDVAELRNNFWLACLCLAVITLALVWLAVAR